MIRKDKPTRCARVFTRRRILHSLDKADPWRKAIDQTKAKHITLTLVRLCTCVLLSISLMISALAAGNESRPIQIAAAASLRTIWTALSEQLPPEIDASDLRISFASTGLLQVQIEHGAPFDLFLAADQISPKRLQEKGLTRGASVPYASGRLVLLSKRSHASSLQEAVADLRKRMQDSPPARLAIANPCHAPYGRASRDWLQSQTLWPWPADSLLLGENTAQALQFVQSNAVDYALLPAALLGPTNDSPEAFQLFDDGYDYIDHHLIIMRNAPPLAETIANWLQSPAAQAVFASYGLDRAEP